MTTTTKIIAGTIIGGTVTFVAFPFVLTALGAASLLGTAGTGTAISTLSGAALTSASCAAVTGTIAGTSAVVTTAGAVAGGVAGAACSSKKKDKK